MTRIVEVTADDVRWPLGGTGTPYVLAPEHVQIDPFPSYPHDVDTVASMLRAVTASAPITLAPHTLYVLHFDTPERVNGWAADNCEWDDASEKWIAAPGTIVLTGKRIPPHPGVTRYLVAHEYGHHIQYAVQARRGFDPHGEQLLAEYAELRRLPDGWQDCSGGRWHSAAGELFANDFRILVADVEPEYWPHPGYARPEDVDGLGDWWAKTLTELV